MKEINKDNLRDYKIAYRVVKDMENNPDDYEIRAGTMNAVSTIKNILANIIASNTD